MNAKKVLGVVGGVVAFAVAYVIAFHGTKSFFGGSVESKIQSMATELNKQLPRQLDPLTRWDRVEAGPGKDFSYFYTIGKNLTEGEQQSLKDNVTRQTLSSPEMKPVFDAGVTVWYKYFDKDGKKVFEFSVKR
jgi:hypothetical protein